MQVALAALGAATIVVLCLVARARASSLLRRPAMVGHEEREATTEEEIYVLLYGERAGSVARSSRRGGAPRVAGHPARSRAPQGKR